MINVKFVLFCFIYLFIYLFIFLFIYLFLFFCAVYCFFVFLLLNFKALKFERYFPIILYLDSQNFIFRKTKNLNSLQCFFMAGSNVFSGN